MMVNEIRTLLLVVFFSAMNVSYVFGSFLENFLDYTRTRKQDQNHPTLNGLDPLCFQKHVSINDTFIRLDVSFNGFLKGYSNYYIEKMVFTPDLNITLVGVLKDTQVSGSYKMNGSCYTVLPVNGDGVYLFLLKNVHITLNAKILPKDGHIQILTFDMDYSFDDFEISIWGLSGDQAVGNILQEFSKDFISSLLKKKKATIVKFIKNYILEQGNAKLITMTLRDIIELIKVLFVY